MIITKSNYCSFKKCAKRLWLQTFKQNEAGELGEMERKIIEDGVLVGEYAKKIFPNTVDVSEKNKVDLNKQIQKTNEAMKNNADVIAEASFGIDDLFVAIDLLKNNKDDSWSIYEIKGSLEINPQYFYDVAFQAYVLKKCGINLKEVYIGHLNRFYSRKGDIEPNKLIKFERVDKNSRFISAYSEIEENINLIRTVLNSKNEISTFFHSGCKECPFYNYCKKDLPNNNLLDLNGFSLNNACDLIEKGIITFEDLNNNCIPLNKRQKVQVDSFIDDISVIVDKDKLKAFLKTITYPLYHLDFETMKEAIPPCDGFHPNEEVAFQYSLHIQTSKCGKVDHKEFLADQFDSRYELAKQLIKDIPGGACVIAYHVSTERNIILKLADLYPDLRNDLLKITENMVDLLEPFKQGYYYDEKMGGSNSIKAVMPALCPHMQEAYHELPLVHNGGEALSMFPIYVRSSGEERKQIREGMLKYCELDTFSMVEVLRVLYEAEK